MKRFFISGCQRSGTTLLRLILDSHPMIQCFDEFVSYNILSSASKKSKLKMPQIKDGEKLIGFKTPRFSEQLTWSIFKDNDYGSFPSFYNGEKVIHIFRNVLDVVGSMIQLKTSDGTTWLDKYGRIILESQISNPNTLDIFKKKYIQLSAIEFPGHLVGSLYWEIKNQGYFELLENDEPVLGISYESLVCSPKIELKKICEFLKVDWDEAILKHHEHPHEELDEDGIAIGDTDSRRPIDTQSIKRHKKILTDEQIDDIQSFSNEFINKIDSEIEI